MNTRPFEPSRKRPINLKGGRLIPPENSPKKATKLQWGFVDSQFISNLVDFFVKSALQALLQELPMEERGRVAPCSYGSEGHFLCLMSVLRSKRCERERGWSSSWGSLWWNPPNAGSECASGRKGPHAFVLALSPVAGCRAVGLEAARV